MALYFKAGRSCPKALKMKETNGGKLSTLNNIETMVTPSRKIKHFLGFRRLDCSSSETQCRLRTEVARGPGDWRSRYGNRGSAAGPEPRRGTACAHLGGDPAHEDAGVAAECEQEFAHGPRRATSQGYAGVIIAGPDAANVERRRPV